VCAAEQLKALDTLQWTCCSWEV